MTPMGGVLMVGVVVLLEVAFGGIRFLGWLARTLSGCFIGIVLISIGIGLWLMAGLPLP